MKGNILVEAKRFVKSLYKEGSPEIFIFSIKDTGDDDNSEVQISTFDLESSILDTKYKKSQEVANHLMKLAKSRFKDCRSIVAMVADGSSPEVFMADNILHIFNLDVQYTLNK